MAIQQKVKNPKNKHINQRLTCLHTQESHKNTDLEDRKAAKDLLLQSLSSYEFWSVDLEGLLLVAQIPSGSSTLSVSSPLGFSPEL